MLKLCSHTTPALVAVTATADIELYLKVCLYREYMHTYIAKLRINVCMKLLTLSARFLQRYFIYNKINGYTIHLFSKIRIL